MEYNDLQSFWGLIWPFLGVFFVYRVLAFMLFDCRKYLKEIDRADLIEFFKTHKLVSFGIILILALFFATVWNLFQLFLSKL